MPHLARRAAWVSAALLLLAAGCALPQRDNPADPLNAPRLAVYVTLADGSHVSEGSHSALWTLDASCATPCPSETFDFDTDGDLSNGYELTNVSSPQHVALPVPPAAFGGLSTVTRTLHVRRRSNGGVATAAPVILTNATPVADPGEDLFVPERRSITVTLDACGGGTGCTSTDSDGDPLSYHWEWLDDDGSLTFTDPDANHRRLVFTSPGAERTYYFRLTASDGSASSRATLRVFVGSQIWASYVAPSRLVRVLPGRVFQAITNTSLPFASCSSGGCFYRKIGFDSETHDEWLVSDLGPSTPQNGVLRHASEPYSDPTTDPKWSVPGEVTSIAAGGGEAVAVVYDPGDGLFHLKVFRASSVLEEVAISGTSTLRYVERALTPGEFVVFSDTAIYKVDANAQPATVTTLATSINTLAEAPGPKGVFWVLGSEAGGDYSVVLVAPDGTTTPYRQITPADGFQSLAEIAPAPDGRAWLYDGAAFKVFLVGSAGAPIEAPVTPILARELFSVPNEGSLWVNDLNVGGLTHLRINGDDISVDVVQHVTDLGVQGHGAPSAYGWDDAAMDPLTGAIHGVGSFNLTTSVDATIPLASGVQELQIPAMFSASPEPTRGSVWSITALTGALTRFSAAARALSATLFTGQTGLAVASTTSGGAWYATSDSSGRLVLTDIASDGTVTGQPVSVTFPASALASGASLSALASGQICAVDRIDTPTGPGVFSVAPGPAVRIDLANGTSELLSPTPTHTEQRVAIGPDGTCWYTDGDPGSAGTLYRVASGQTASAAGVALPAHALGLAIDPFDGSLFVRHDNGISHVSTAGAITALSGVPSGVGGGIAVADHCDTASDPKCLDLWFTADTTIYRAEIVSNALQILESYPLPTSAPDDLNALPGDALLP